MTLQEAKETTVFEIQDGEVVERNLYEKMCDSTDITTTPRGVGPRFFIEECEYKIDSSEFDEDDLESEFRFIDTLRRPASREDFEELPNGIFSLKYFVISTWGCKGNRYQRGGGLFDTYLTLEEAEEEMFESLQMHYDEDWENSCNSYSTREEAEEVINDRNS